MWGVGSLLLFELRIALLLPRQPCHICEALEAKAHLRGFLIMFTSTYSYLVRSQKL